MNVLKRLTQLLSKKGSRPGRRRLLLEDLETRVLPASVFVVPLATPTDAAHFHSLTNALAGAGQGGTVTIEPGARPDGIDININQPGITIKGDPNVPASTLPLYTLVATVSGVVLTNLNVDTLTFGNGNHSVVVTRCNIAHQVQGTAASGNGSDVIAENVIGDAVLNSSTLDVISNNTFTNVSSNLLTINHSSNVIVTSNTFVGDANFQQAIDVTDSGTTSAPVLLSNNSIALQGMGSSGIAVSQFTGTVFVRILNNSINVPERGLAFQELNAANLQALVQGNDFHNESHAVDVFGDGTNAAASRSRGWRLREPWRE
jgi:hypothetical protein